MSIFGSIKELFTPVAELVDNVHSSDEEMGQLKNELAKIEARTFEMLVEYEGKLLDARTAIAKSEQEHGNWLSKSHRPITSLCFVATIMSMAYGLIPYNELVIQIGGAFLGVYGLSRTYEKSSGKLGK